MIPLLTSFFTTTPIGPWFSICIAAFGIEDLFRAASQPPVRNRLLNLGSGFFLCVSAFILTPLVSYISFIAAKALGSGFIDLRFFTHDDSGSQLLSALILLFIADLLYYVWHRAQHSITFLWHIHAPHHTDRHLNATTYLRQHWLEPPLQQLLIGVPTLLLFKLTPIQMSLITLGNLGFFFFAHMNVRLQLGRYSGIITGPQLHRLHHSRLPQHWNKNYAQIFPMIDKVFGTYQAPLKNEFPPTGLPREDAERLSDLLLWPFRRWMGRRY